MIKLLTKRNHPEFTEQSEALMREVNSLTLKVAKLQKENDYLRHTNKVRPHLRIVLRAEVSAHYLCMWHCSGLLTGRESAFAFGMSHNTFYAGRALCMLANVHDGEAWTTDDIVVIQQRIQEALEYAKKRPDALLAHIPPSKQPKSRKLG